MFRVASPLLLAASLAVIAAGSSVPARADEPGTATPFASSATHILARHLSREEFPGAVLSLRDPSGASFTITAGAAASGQGDPPIDPNTPWIIDSTTKTFVAVVVLQLVQEGKLELDGTVEPFLPDLPAASQITTRALLQHTSGVNEYIDSDTVLRDARRAWSASELIAVAVARGPMAEPGAGFHYANTNYLLLGEIIEKVTARPWHDEVRSRILEPLGLEHTGYAGETAAPPIGTGHILEDGRFVVATERWHASIGGAAGGMYSTTGDLLAFTLALFEGQLLDAPTAAEMQRFVPGTDHGHVGHAYGLGLERYTLRDLTVLGHLGVGSAHSAFIGYDPTRRAAVAVLINAANAGPSAFIGAEMLAEVAGTDLSPPPLPSASVGATLFAYRTLHRVGTGERIGEVRVSAQRANVSCPIVVNGGRTRLELSAAYQRIQFDYRGFTPELESVQSIGVTAFLRQKLTDDWGLLLVVAPGYADDFEGPASLDAVTATLVAAGTYRFSDSLEVGFGAAIENVFGEPLPLPVVSVDWALTERLWLKLILPVNTELTWLPVDALGLRVSVQANGNNYHGAERIYGVRNPQLNYSTVSADLGVRWFVLPFLHLTVSGGHTLYRRFEFSQDGQPAPGGKFDLDNGPFFTIEVGAGR